ncbi:DUF3592 domain-containing protein [Kribbella sp. NPDC051770]|uniref:DUF3592 domain-containing protein n=1 Tax=Kribbella sp. NPDC051770 TaxID=3155413 RepID=UPI00343B94B5
MLTIIVLGGFGLVLLVTACIVSDVFAGGRKRRRGLGEERTAGRVVRVRGPLRGQVEGGVPAEYVEVLVEYYTRRGEGPFQVSRRLPTASRNLYAAEDRAIVSYDVRNPRRSRVEGRVSHWPQLGPRSSDPGPSALVS